MSDRAAIVLHGVVAFVIVLIVVVLGASGAIFLGK